MAPGIWDKLKEASHLILGRNSPRKYWVLCSEGIKDLRGYRSLLGPEGTRDNFQWHWCHSSQDTSPGPQHHFTSCTWGSGRRAGVSAPPSDWKLLKNWPMSYSAPPVVGTSDCYRPRPKPSVQLQPRHIFHLPRAACLHLHQQWGHKVSEAWPLPSRHSWSEGTGHVNKEVKCIIQKGDVVNNTVLYFWKLLREYISKVLSTRKKKLCAVRDIN